MAVRCQICVCQAGRCGRSGAAGGLRGRRRSASAGPSVGGRQAALASNKDSASNTVMGFACTLHMGDDTRNRGPAPLKRVFPGPEHSCCLFTITHQMGLGQCRTPCFNPWSTEASVVVAGVVRVPPQDPVGRKQAALPPRASTIGSIRRRAGRPFNDTQASARTSTASCPWSPAR